MGTVPIEASGSASPGRRSRARTSVGVGRAGSAAGIRAPGGGCDRNGRMAIVPGALLAPVLYSANDADRAGADDKAGTMNDGSQLPEPASVDLDIVGERYRADLS